MLASVGDLVRRVRWGCLVRFSPSVPVAFVSLTISSLHPLKELDACGTWCQFQIFGQG